MDLRLELPVLARTVLSHATSSQAAPRILREPIETAELNGVFYRTPATEAVEHSCCCGACACGTRKPILSACKPNAAFSPQVPVRAEDRFGRAVTRQSLRRISRYLRIGPAYDLCFFAAVPLPLLQYDRVARSAYRGRGVVRISVVRSSGSDRVTLAGPTPRKRGFQRLGEGGRGREFC